MYTIQVKLEVNGLVIVSAGTIWTAEVLILVLGRFVVVAMWRPGVVVINSAATSHVYTAAASVTSLTTQILLWICHKHVTAIFKETALFAP